jgi:hypothetical protein
VPIKDRGGSVYPQQPPQQPQPQQPGGAIALTLKYHWSAFMLGLFKPVVEINGHQAANAWGRQVIPVPPGQYHLHVHVPYFLPPRLGSADLPVNVYPGQTVELEYRAPLAVFFKGALGTSPQKYPGAALQIALLAVVLIILLCACGGILIGAAGSNSSLPELVGQSYQIASLAAPGGLARV